MFKEGLAIAEDTLLTAKEKTERLKILKIKSKEIKRISPVLCESPEEREKEESVVLNGISEEKLRAIYDP